MQVYRLQMEDGEVHEDDTILHQLQLKIVRHTQLHQTDLDKMEFEQQDERERVVHRVFDHGDDLDEEEDERVMDREDEEDIHEDETDEEHEGHIMVE